MKKQFITIAAAIGLCMTGHAALTSQLGILDLTANGGINPATGVAWQAGDTYRLAFVTSGTTDGTSTDIATYNTFVNTAADNSTAYGNLGSVNWFAMVSTATVNVKVNTGTDSGVGEGTFLLNGTSNASEVFANNYADLWDGNAQNGRLRYTENGDLRQGNYPDTAIWGSWTAVWTGSNGTGDTNSALGTANPRHGLVNAEQQFWFNRSTAANTNTLPVYAMSEVLTVIPEPSVALLSGLGVMLLLRRRKR